ncbi:cytochrome C oxidase subunit IV family protein [Halomonas sp. V046]|uniref:cytochrome C oxidase subunit IV family protein n=1 Tax=Halomonas sp. V046 TaxID=3459611 RepID=UPI004043AF49
MTPPPARRLWIAWAMLMALTLVSMGASGLHPSANHSADASDLAAGLSPVAVVLILLASGIKAHRILADYLDLRAAPASWRGLFTALVMVMIGAMGAAVVLPAWIA